DVGRRLGVERHVVAADLSGAGDSDLPPLAVRAGSAVRKPTEVEPAVLGADVHVRAIINDQVEILGRELVQDQSRLTGAELPLPQSQGLDSGGETGARRGYGHEQSPL